MAGSPPELIACPDCGALQEDASLLLAQAQADIEGLERDLRVKRAKITRLEGERHDKLKASKRFGEAMTVLRYWNEKLAPNAREIDSPDRLECVIARLNGKYPVEDLKLCIDGYAKKPYVTRDGRSAHGTPAQRKVEATLIFGDPKHVDNGIAWANSSTFTDEDKPVGDISRLDWRKVKAANRALVVRALTEQYGPGLQDRLMAHTLWPCPRCDDDVALTLRVSDDPHLSYIAECWRCGLNESRLIAAITEE